MFAVTLFPLKSRLSTVGASIIIKSLEKKLLAKSKAHSKKKAEEKASKIAMRILKLNP